MNHIKKSTMTIISLLLVLLLLVVMLYSSYITFLPSRQRIYLFLNSDLSNRYMPNNYSLRKSYWKLIIIIWRRDNGSMSWHLKFSFLSYKTIQRNVLFYRDLHHAGEFLSDAICSSIQYQIIVYFYFVTYHGGGVNIFTLRI